MKFFVKGSFLFIILLLCFGYLWGVSHAAIQEKQETKESSTLSDEQLARARTLFGEKCARCHGADGRGQTTLGDMLGVPDFTDSKWLKEKKSDERLIKSIANGRDRMPAFGKKLTGPEIASLVAYVRRFNKSARQSTRP